jgi:hypothetical protein
MLPANVIPRIAAEPAMQGYGACYNNLMITITRMITINRPIMMTSLVLGELMKYPGLNAVAFTASDRQSVLNNPGPQCASAQSIRIFSLIL